MGGTLKLKMLCEDMAFYKGNSAWLKELTQHIWWGRILIHRPLSIVGLFLKLHFGKKLTSKRLQDVCG